MDFATVVLLFSSLSISAFNSPDEFKAGSSIEVMAGKLTSIQTQLPYDYYALPFCQPLSGIVYKTESLGEVLTGDHLVNTPYEVKVATNAKCQALCQDQNGTYIPVELNKDQNNDIINKVQHDYYVHLVVDNLPCATHLIRIDDGFTFYELGYQLGFLHGKEAYLHNHLNLILSYHRREENALQIVGFKVQSRSVAKRFIKVDEKTGLCQIHESGNPQKINDNASTSVWFTYSVEWKESDVEWASRWDIYLGENSWKQNWFCFCHMMYQFLIVSVLFTGVMARTLPGGIPQYSKDDDLVTRCLSLSLKKDVWQEWKLVHGDVFRPPCFSMFFICLIGAGIQIFLMAFISIFLALLGILSSPASDSLMTVCKYLYMFMGLFAGYFSARLCKTMKILHWKKTAFGTATVYPAVMFGIGLLLNFFIWGKQSPGDVSLMTINLIPLLCMLLGISLPLIFMGFYFGFRKQVCEHSIITNQIARLVPKQSWYMNPFLETLMVGIVPFFVTFLELQYIFQAILENKAHFYSSFGWLFLNFIFFVVLVSQLAVIAVYFQLCWEDYHWWWRTFIVSGGSAVYVFAFAVYCYFTRFEATEFIPTLLYFGYTIMLVVTLWVFSGTIGFFAAYWFIRRIYGTMKKFEAL